jgi:hypothetical protein
MGNTPGRPAAGNDQDKGQAMTAVNIKGTFAKDSRTRNGLEPIADQLIKDQFSAVLVVGIVHLHKFTGKPGEEVVPTVEFVAIEPVFDDDATTVRDLIDRYAERRGGPIAPDPLPLGADAADSE